MRVSPAVFRSVKEATHRRFRQESNETNDHESKNDLDGDGSSPGTRSREVGETEINPISHHRTRRDPEVGTNGRQSEDERKGAIR